MRRRSYRATDYKVKDGCPPGLGHPSSRIAEPLRRPTMLSPVPLRSTFALAAALAVIFAPSAEARSRPGPLRRGRAAHPRGRPRRERLLSPRRLALAHAADQVLGGGARQRAGHPHGREDLEPERRAGALRGAPRAARDVAIRYWPQAGCVGGGVRARATTRTRAARSAPRCASPGRTRSTWPAAAGRSRWSWRTNRPRARSRPRAAPLRADEHPARDALAERCQPPLEPWRWRCRILERDDVRGAVRIYGGRASGAAARSATCSPRPPPRPRWPRAPNGLGGSR